MRNINKHGLKRYIEEDVRLKIRQEAGFGCVICGCGIVDYEHIFPEFSECKEHDPEKMTLLCPRCHAKKTRGFLNTDTIWRAKNNPFCLTKGHSNEFIDFGKVHPRVIIGGSLFEFVEHVIVIDNTSVLSINKPLTENDVFSISARFYSDNSKLSLAIERNQWVAFNTNWDVNVSGGKIMIKNDNNKYNLILDFNTENTIIIEKINMRFDNCTIEGDRESVTIHNLVTNTIVKFVEFYSHDNSIGLII